MLESWENGSSMEMVDVEVCLLDLDLDNGIYKTELLYDLLNIALACVAPNPNERPTMAQCVGILCGEPALQMLEMNGITSRETSAIYGSMVNSEQFRRNDISLYHDSSSLGSGPNISVSLGGVKIGVR